VVCMGEYAVRGIRVEDVPGEPGAIELRVGLGHSPDLVMVGR
jgi:hypothetical protein